MTIIDTGALAQHLIDGRNPDGGWGYYRGKSTRLEPTAWALLALSTTEAGRKRGDSSLMAAPLSSWTTVDGLLLERASGTVNFGFHGLALLVLEALGAEHRDGNSALVSAIQRVKGVALENGAANPTQDNRLQAWSWTADTFSWIEPTAWCLLALKKRRQHAPREVDASRVDVAERLVINRTCATGGWNYGNADVLGQDLRAYVPTTALGLLAMQDRTQEEPIRRSLSFLDAHGVSESSGSALALAMIALRTLGRDDAAVRAQLLTQLPMTLDVGNHAGIATALYALNSADRYAAFTL